MVKKVLMKGSALQLYDPSLPKEPMANSSVFKAHRLGQPSYLSVQPYIPVRLLRSSDADLLYVPASRTATADRHFSCAAPRIWNSLPSHVKAASSVDIFKSRLKTHLFCDTA